MMKNPSVRTTTTAILPAGVAPGHSPGCGRCTPHDPAVDVAPLSRAFHVRLVELPAVADRVPAWLPGLGQQRREPLDPALSHRDVEELLAERRSAGTTAPPARSHPAGTGIPRTADRGGLGTRMRRRAGTATRLPDRCLIPSRRAQRNSTAVSADRCPSKCRCDSEASAVAS